MSKKAYENLICQLNREKALSEVQKQRSEINSLVQKSSGAQAELEALIESLGGGILETINEQSKSKTRGIALTHMEGQGGAANGRNIPLLMKAKGKKVEINKALRTIFMIEGVK